MGKTSAGILPYRRANDGSMEVLLVHPGGPFWKHKDAHAWSVVKGEHEPDEDPLDDAEREFAEELGFPAPVGRRLDLGDVHQSNGKIVRAWAVEVEDLPLEHMVSNLFELEWPPHSGTVQRFPEVDRAEWMTIARARPRLVRAQAAFLDRLENRAARATER
jgi:predicted NUDIX family NTP pyrophosphohydrolase